MSNSLVFSRPAATCPATSPTALHNVDPADKAELYSRLALTMTYHPNEKRVAAEARPAQIMYVGACPRGLHEKADPVHRS
jgi:hypothetical protein